MQQSPADGLKLAVNVPFGKVWHVSCFVMFVWVKVTVSVRSPISGVSLPYTVMFWDRVMVWGDVMFSVVACLTV